MKSTSLKGQGTMNFTELVRLVDRAAAAAGYRGHYSLRWGTTGSKSLGTCLKCGAWVQCDTDPHGVDIGGPAVAVSCLSD